MPVETDKSVQYVAQSFHDDGFVVLPNVLPKGLVACWRDFAEEYFERTFQVLHEHGHTEAPCHQNADGTFVLGLGAKHGFSEVVMRSPGRYELSLKRLDESPKATQFWDSLKHPRPDRSTLETALKDLLPHLVGPGANTKKDETRGMDKLKLCHFSLLVATPGATDQAWHADGGHQSIEKHLPCHVFNVFVPLQDVPHAMGPTEFRPGGHFLTRNLGPMMLAAKCRKTLRPPIWPALSAGDLVLFDYRTLHRGRANHQQSPRMTRHILVLTYSEPWFEDVLNFPTRSMMEQKANM